MRAKLASVNDCAVPFLSRAAANLCCYYYRPRPRYSLLVESPIPHKMQKIALKNVVSGVNADNYVYIKGCYIIAVAQVFL